MDKKSRLAGLELETPRALPPNRFTVSKPWGGFDQFTLNERSTVKIVTVLPGDVSSR